MQNIYSPSYLYITHEENLVPGGWNVRYISIRIEWLNHEIWPELSP